MNEDTRTLILRIQSEDLAALWNAPNNDTVEIDATLRVYRRQLGLLDRHLDDKRQTKTTDDVRGIADHGAVTSVLQVTDTDATVNPEDGEAHQCEGVGSRQKTFHSATLAPSTPSTANAITERSLAGVSNPPIVHRTLSTATVERQLDKHYMEPAFQLEQAGKVREEAEKTDGTGNQVNTLKTPIKTPRQLQHVPSRVQPGEDMAIHDIFEVQDQKKVERMMTVAPNRAISVLYAALKTCHGSFDDAIYMVFSQEMEQCPKTIDSDIEDSHSELKPINSQSLASQQIKATTRAFSNEYSINPKSTTTTLSTAVESSPSLVSTEPIPTAGTNLKRSADHFVASDALQSGKQAGTIVKNKRHTMPAQKDTIKDKFKRFQALLKSSGSLPSPTPPTKKQRRVKRTGRSEVGRIRGLGLGNREQTPDTKPEVPDHVSTEPEFVTPDMPSGMIRPDTGHHDQRFDDLQLGSFSQTLSQTLPVPHALDIKALDAATPAQKKQMLGQALFPKIQAVQPQLVGKITGMLLEMNDNELLFLTTDDAALHNKIEEAVCVYNDYLEANRAEDA